MKSSAARSDLAGSDQAPRRNLVSPESDYRQSRSPLVLSDIHSAVCQEVFPVLVSAGMHHNAKTFEQSYLRRGMSASLHESSMIVSADIDAIQRLIQPHGVVFDIGDDDRHWAREFPARQAGYRIYAGKAFADASRPPANPHSTSLKLARFLPTEAARGDDETASSPSHHDLDLEDPQALGDFCTIEKIRHINILRVTNIRSDIAISIINGLKVLIKIGRVNFIIIENLFDREDAFLKGNISATLESFGYIIHPMTSARSSAEGQDDSISTSHRSGFIAVHERLSGAFVGSPPKMLDVHALLKEHGVNPRGVVHVGAFDGKEVAFYREAGARRIFLIEANPILANELHRVYAGSDDVQVAACAAGEIHRIATFHITSGRQSSSLLPLGRHKDIYPSIVEVEQVEVTVERIDDMITKKGRMASEFNILNMDIQGAERLALMGAPELLKHVEAINIEVNFEELYEGCAQIEDIEAILEPAGFHRVAMVCPFHASWGDAFYIRGPTGMKAQESHRIVRNKTRADA